MRAPVPAIPIEDTPAAERSRIHLLMSRSWRLWGLLFGILLPLCCLVLVTVTKAPLEEWQSGTVEAYAGAVLDSRAMWPVFPLILFAMISFARFAASPTSTHWCYSVSQRLPFADGLILA